MAIDATEEQFEKLNSILSVVNSGMMSNFKSNKAAELAHKNMIKTIMKLNDVSEKHAESILQEIKAEDDRAKKAEQREKSIVDGVKKSLQGLQQFFGGAVNATQALYNSENAFSAVIPTVNLLGDTVKTITSALMSFGAGIPIIGGLFSGFDKLTSAAVDMTIKVMGMQLENAQKIVNEYNTLSKAGMTFGASIEDMRESAANAGMSMSTYTKFVTSNIEHLSTLGASLETSSAQVGKMSNLLAKNNAGLLTIYGGYEGLASATAEYQAMMAKYGIDIAHTDKDMTLGAQAYLLNLKEMSSITGKNAQALKKDEEARQRSAAYQLVVGRMGLVQQANLQRGLEVATKMYGQTAHDYAQEFIATNGNVTSKTALQFQAMFPEIAKTVQMTLAETGRSKTEFDAEQARIIEGRKDLNRVEIQGREHLLKLQAGGVQNAILEMMNTVSSATLKSFTAQGDLPRAVDEFQKNAARLAEANLKGETTVSKVIASLESMKMSIDELTVKQLPEIGKLTERLIALNKKILDSFTGPVQEQAVNKFAWAVEKLVDALTSKATAGTTPLPTTEVAKIQRESAEKIEKEAIERAKSPNASVEDRVAARIAQDEAKKARMAEESARMLASRLAGVVPRNLSPGSPATAGVVPRFPIKGNEYTEAGSVQPKLTEALNLIYDRVGKSADMLVTAGHDLEHTTGGHAKGVAADIKIRDTNSEKNLKSMTDKINELLKEHGIKGKAEIHEDTDLSTGRKTGGKHIHLQLSDAEKRAEADAKMTNETLAQMLDVMSQQRDINEKLLRVMS